MSRKLIFAAVFSVTIHAAFCTGAMLPFYVSDFGTFNTSVLTDTGYVTSSPSYNSGQLQQLSVTGGNNTGVAGSLKSAGTPHIQSADGSIADVASIGALHTLVEADATTDNYPYGNYTSATSTSSIHSVTSWFDTVTFLTSNPAGSDFIATLTLDDDIQNSATDQTGSTYSIGSSIRATCDIANFGAQHPTLGIVDTEALHSDGPISTPPPSYSQSVTIHATNFETLTFLETLDVNSTALGGNTSTVADASDTAKFNLITNDPLASYTTASGVTFIPEPASLGLLAMAALCTILGTGLRRVQDSIGR